MGWGGGSVSMQCAYLKTWWGFGLKGLSLVEVLKGVSVLKY